MKNSDYLLLRRKTKTYIHFRLLRRLDEICSVLKALTEDQSEGRENIRLLDIGSFDGFIPSEIEKTFPFIDCYCLDKTPSPPVGEGRERGNILPVTLADACFLPYKNNSFDIVLASAVVEHIKETDLFLEEAGRVLKKGGYLIITYPNPFFDFINTAIKDTGHISRFSRRKITRELKKAGYELREFSGFLLCPFPGKREVSFTESLLARSFFSFFLLNRLVLAVKI